MKLPQHLLLTATLLAAMATPAAFAGSVNVILENVEKAEGQLMIQLMSSEAEFEGTESAVASLIWRARSGQMSFNLANLPEGEYGLRIMQDLNGNNELDSNFVGKPKEPWGFSNNAVGNMGPPAWKDVKFTVEGDVVQKIRPNH